MTTSLRQAEQIGADLVVFGELAITGYPPEDLLYRDDFIEKNEAAVVELAKRSNQTAVIVGYVERDPADTNTLYNSAAICANGEIKGNYRKQFLPNTMVFDEKRYFKPGDNAPLWSIAGTKIGLNICEDMWHTKTPCISMANEGAQLLITINGSPFHKDKEQERHQAIKKIATSTKTPMLYVNLVGAQDELVFDGRSTIFNGQGELVAQANAFQEELLVADIITEQKIANREVPLVTGMPTILKPDIEPPIINSAEDPHALTWEALKLGLNSYVINNGFSEVCIGLSGGIDSALTAVLAAECFGAKNVHAIMMPSRYSSDHSITDSELLANNLGINLYKVPIEEAHKTFLNMFEEPLGTDLGITDENLQSRIRGLILMAFSNKFSWLTLATGNKSELAVGYSTLYGDTVGGYAPIKDLWKTEVYELANWFNKTNGASQNPALIPENIINKPASAELRPDQRDDQSLPPYEILDQILEAYVEQNLSPQIIFEMGFKQKQVEDVIRLVNRAEYKRRQTPIGTRISKRAFGKDRRMPITNHFLGEIE